MTLDADPTPIYALERKERLIQERLEQNRREQYRLRELEGQLRTELTHIENERYKLVQPNFKSQETPKKI